MGSKRIPKNMGGGGFAYSCRFHSAGSPAVGINLKSCKLIHYWLIPSAKFLFFDPHLIGVRDVILLWQWQCPGPPPNLPIILSVFYGKIPSTHSTSRQPVPIR
jgi:hypothetical protein